jgi:hypothetical protein
LVITCVRCAIQTALFDGRVIEDSVIVPLRHRLNSRREFGKITLAGLPLSLALGPIDSRVDGVRIGVQSYSFRTLPLDVAIKAMSDIGIDPVAYIEEYRDRISNLHIKDRKKNHVQNTPWGEGDTPIKQVLHLLKGKKYDIPADIEFEYRGADPVVEGRKCFRYCRDALT